MAPLWALLIRTFLSVGATKGKLAQSSTRKSARLRAELNAGNRCAQCASLVFLQGRQIVTFAQESSKTLAHLFQFSFLPLRRYLIQEHRVELSLALRIAQEILLLLLLANEEREVRARVLRFHHHVEAVEQGGN